MTRIAYRELLRLAGVADGAAALAGQLAADGRRSAAEVGRDSLLSGALGEQVGYAIPFLDRKLI